MSGEPEKVCASGFKTSAVTLRLWTAIVWGILTLTNQASLGVPTLLVVAAIWLALMRLSGYSPIYRLGHITTTARHLGAPGHWGLC